MSIRIDAVSKAYKGGGAHAVNEVTLEVHDGEFMVLVGPSGCGKSTLLKLIAGIEEVSGGRIFIGDRDVTDLDPRKRDIAMVFQSYALYPHLSVRGNLGFGLKLRKTSKAETAQRVDEVARILGLEELMDRKPGELSGGQRQRVAMGRAIVREPQAFLMDEPLSNLDAKLRVSMRAQLSRLHERLGVTTVYVTHDQVEAMTLGQRVAVMRGGVLQQCDTPERLFDHPANLFVAAFIGSPAMNLVAAEGGRFGSCQVASPVDGHCILGMRPHDLKLGPGIPAVVQVVERLGTETNVVAGIDAPRLRAPALADAVDASAADDDVLLAEDDRASLTVVLDARAPVAVGDRIELTIDPDRLHHFDVETGEALSQRAASPSVPAPAGSAG